ncbi:MAG: class I SAM-dependent methyltransferase [Gemmatimonadota bacterium]|nr:class I SAM-dependent methyltransferase [Gemmatimonadota bacterium]
MRPPADHFSRHAPAYASHRPRYPEGLFDYLDTQVPGHNLAWDCAAGSGQATLPLARRFNRVVATDISAAMLQHAPRHPAVDYRVAPAEASGLEDACVDLVTVAQALHWLDSGTFYAEATRVLVSGGVLAVWTYGEQRLDEPALDHAVRNFYSNIGGPYWPAERRHVDSGYRTLSFPFPEIEPPPLIMQENWSLAQFLGYVGTWSATQRFCEAVGHDPVGGLRQDLEQHWGDPSASRRILWPICLRIGFRPA